MNFIDTVAGSLLENFYPSGWDFAKIDDCCNTAFQPGERHDFWHKDFNPVACESLADFNPMLGHEIALEIKTARDQGKQLALILPVGPMGMYSWVVYFLKAWNVPCDHVHGFNMDEWSDASGNTLPANDPAAFQNAMEQAFYGPLGALTVPKEQRHYATKEALPLYAPKIAALKQNGARLVTVYGIGRMCHIAFWEPQFGGEYDSNEAWAAETHRIAALLHPLTIEQNAITSFKSRTTLVPCRANTVGPGLFLQSDRMIGGCDGALSRGMQWQGMSFLMTLRYGPDRFVASSFVPTKPGTLFYLSELAGPLGADCN